MALPLQNTPTYNMVVPSTKQKIRFRPFLIKEEKSLLIAQQSEDMMVMVDTLKNVIRGCVLDKIDVDKLATFDIEYIFTQIRARSVGENVDILVQCDEDHGELNEKARVKIIIDLSTIQVITPEGHTNKIQLFDDVGMVMKYPTVEVLTRLENTETEDIEAVFAIVADSVDMIYQGDEIFHAEETPHEEILQFLNNLTSDQFAKVQQFFSTMPKIKKDIEYKCPVCGKEHKKTLEGMESFF
jgi:hypothetical protein